MTPRNNASKQHSDYKKRMIIAKNGMDSNKKTLYRRSRLKFNEAHPLPGKNRGRTGKGACRSGEQEEIPDKTHAGRGQEINWEISVYSVIDSRQNLRANSFMGNFLIFDRLVNLFGALRLVSLSGLKAEVKYYNSESR
jgi:hypothetical protein